MTADAIAGPKGHPWTDMKPHPWRRLLARLLDTHFAGTITFVLATFIGAIFAPEATTLVAERVSAGGVWAILSGIAVYIAAIPGQALMIGLAGGGPGKWMLGVRVVGRDDKPIGVLKALWREVQVLIFGLGLGLPLISLLALLSSQGRLIDRQPAIWDGKSGRKILHRPEGTGQKIATAVAALVAIVLQGWGYLAAANPQ